MSAQHEGQAAAGPDLAAPHSDWAPFASRAFFWLWLANTVSGLGTAIQNTASAWLMTELVPSPLMVSLVQAAAQFPALLLALPAGALADLMDRKRHLILTNMLMLAAASTLAIVAALHRLDAAILLSLTALLAVGAALNGPAWAASVPLTVPRRSLTQALVLNSVGFNIARAVGRATLVTCVRAECEIELVAEGILHLGVIFRVIVGSGPINDRHSEISHARPLLPPHHLPGVAGLQQVLRGFLILCMVGGRHGLAPPFRSR
jgi:MFS family permease